MKVIQKRLEAASPKAYPVFSTNVSLCAFRSMNHLPLARPVQWVHRVKGILPPGRCHAARRRRLPRQVYMSRKLLGLASNESLQRQEQDASAAALVPQQTEWSYGKSSFAAELPD